MKVSFYRSVPESDPNSRLFFRKTVCFEDRETALEFARHCWTSDGDLSLDDDWLDSLPVKDQLEILR